MHDSAPVRRCGTERRTGHQRQEGGNDDGNRDGGGEGNKYEDGNGHEDRDMGAGTGAGAEAIIERTEERGESPGTYELVIEVNRKTRERGRNQRVTSSHRRTIRRPARPSHYAEDQSPGTGGEGQDRGGWSRGVEAQETSEEL